MFNCKFSLCEHVSQTVIEFIQHSKLHSNAPDFMYHCGVPECSRICRKSNALKSHMYREHIGRGSSVQRCKWFEIPLKSVAQLCTFTCDTLSSLIKHLKSHIQEGLEIKCPVRGCDCSFTVASSLASHFSRKHRDLDHALLCVSDPTEPSSTCSQPCSDTFLVEDTEPEREFAVDETLYLQNLALLYLKLQGMLLLPSSTIHTIIEDFQNAHEIGLSHSYMD